MFKPRFLPSVLIVLTFTPCFYANAYELNEEGIPIAEQTHFNFTRNTTGGSVESYGHTNYTYGSDFQTELESGLAAVVKGWDVSACNPNTVYHGCRTGDYTYELVELTPGDDHWELDAYGVYDEYEWTLKFPYDWVHSYHPPVPSVHTERGWFRAYWSCPSPLVLGRERFLNADFDPPRWETRGPFVCEDSSNNGFCPAGYRYDPNASTNKCTVQCAPGSIWNPTLKQCEQELKEESCRTQSKNPIDFFSGRKYRTEKVVSVGVRQPFELNYLYDSKNGAVGTSAGTILKYPDSSAPVDDAVPELAVKAYGEEYSKEGFSKLDPTVLQGQYYGYMHDYWRHNFDDVLQIRSGTYILHTADGKQLSFQGYGVHRSHSQLKLDILLSGAESFSGYEVSDYSKGTKKRFDQSGRLRKVLRGSNDVLTLTYNQNRLQSIHNSEGASLEFSEYSALHEDSIYSFSESMREYPTKISTSDGRHVAVEWGYSDKSPTRTSHLITKITRPFVSDVESSREFGYDHWYRLLSDIYDIDEITNQRSLYAHFEYDGQKRAVVSELGGGFERVGIDYSSLDERVVTNANGLSTTYQFANFEGVRRLQSISGGETANCAPTNTIYTYYPSGSVETQVTNGVTTHFIYNSRNLVEIKTEAFGTPSAITTKTCWHDTLTKPERVIEAKRVTKFQYYANGDLKSQAVEARTSNNENCQ